MTRHIYLISIKNRKTYIIDLVNQLKDKYKNSKYELCFSVVDFNSTDCDMNELFKSLEVNFYFQSIDSNFNLGLGWNKAAFNINIKEDELIIFICNDIKIGEKFNISKRLNHYTLIDESVYIPVHASEDENGSYHFGGGAALWSCYKRDFINIGNIPESECWGDAHTVDNKYVGEDDFFWMTAEKKGYSVVRYQEPNIIARWHVRDLKDNWYSKSKCMKDRKWNNPNYKPKWWTLHNNE